MATQILNRLKSSAPFWVCLVVSLALIIGSFFVPTMGVIDESVLNDFQEFATI